MGYINTINNILHYSWSIQKTESETMGKLKRHYILQKAKIKENNIIEVEI